MPQINLLPPELKARARTRRLFTLAAALLVILLVLLGIVTVFQRSTISREEDRLAELQTEAAQLRSQVASLAQFGQLKADVDQTRQTLATALAGDVAWSKLLNDLSLIMPDNSWLVSLNLNAQPDQAPNGQPSVGTTTFQGFVFDFPGLAGWLTRIAQLEGLTFVYLTTGTRTELVGQEVVSFGANANITQSMLSQRCQEGQPCP